MGQQVLEPGRYREFGLVFREVAERRFARAQANRREPAFAGPFLPDFDMVIVIATWRLAQDALPTRFALSRQQGGRSGELRGEEQAWHWLVLDFVGQPGFLFLDADFARLPVEPNPDLIPDSGEWFRQAVPPILRNGGFEG